MFKKLSPIIVLISLLSFSCERDFSVLSLATSNDNREIRPMEKEVLSASSRFGITLFKEISRTEAGKNVFMSPFSVSAALGMTLNGARNKTEADMRSALGFSGMEQDEINQAYRNLSEWLVEADPKVIFDAAQSIWYRQPGFSVEAPFIEANRIYFDALVRGIDFTVPSSKDTINNWIEQNTGGKIQDMITHIKPTDVMFLVNAIFFKGIWKIRFDPKTTQDGVFFLGDGSEKTCRMMQMGDSLMYMHSDDVRAVDLAYGDGAFSMLILLPPAQKTVDAFIRELTPEKWEGWTDGLRKTRIDLAMPKFKTLYDTQLSNPLTAMGMGVAFTGEADFTGINRAGELFMDRVLHKAFVEVNEEGTEAAAATVVVIGRTSIGGPVEMVINRPFVFAIRERRTGAILFIGKIENPA